MSYALRKFVAVLLALWLPLFSGSVMAAAVSMQLHTGQSHHQSFDASDEAMPDDMSDMQHGDECRMHAASDQAANHAAAHDHQDHPCSACGVCHLAASGYLAVSALTGLPVMQTQSAAADYLLSFESVTSIPLLPPPLVRA